MESEKTFPVRIPCPIHPSEELQRVDVDPFVSPQLYCLDCILAQESSDLVPQNLKTIPDLFERAANFYHQNRKSIATTEEIPSEYLDLLGSQSEKLEQLSKHIENEKKKMSKIFDSILEDVIKIISQSKKKCLDELDQQLGNFQCWYLFFGKQMKKTYPTEEDISFLYPTKQDLLEKLSQITNAFQLDDFVRDLKEDLNEDKLAISGDQKAFLKDLSQELRNLDNIRPHYSERDLERSKMIKNEIQGFVEKIFSGFPELKSPVGDVFKGPRLESILLQGKHLSLLREWIPKDLKFRLKLLYRGSRDGLSGPAFHERCDGIRNTITVIKCTFKGTSSSSLIGGFLDEAWVSTGSYIASQGSFIFSLTTQKKCANTNSTYGGVGTLDYGPCFGGGYDIGTLYQEGKSDCWVKPESYSSASQIIDSPNYCGFGKINFTLEDIEVFCLV